MNKAEILRNYDDIQLRGWIFSNIIGKSLEPKWKNSFNNALALLESLSTEELYGIDTTTAARIGRIAGELISNVIEADIEDFELLTPYKADLITKTLARLELDGITIHKRPPENGRLREWETERMRTVLIDGDVSSFAAHLAFALNAHESFMKDIEKEFRSEIDAALTLAQILQAYGKVPSSVSSEFDQISHRVRAHRDAAYQLSTGSIGVEIPDAGQEILDALIEAQHSEVILFKFNEHADAFVRSISGALTSFIDPREESTEAHDVRFAAYFGIISDAVSKIPKEGIGEKSNGALDILIVAGIKSSYQHSADVLAQYPNLKRQGVLNALEIPTSGSVGDMKL